MYSGRSWKYIVLQRGRFHPAPEGAEAQDVEGRLGVQGVVVVQLAKSRRRADTRPSRQPQHLQREYTLRVVVSMFRFLAVSI